MANSHSSKQSIALDPLCHLLLIRLPGWMPSLQELKAESKQLSSQRSVKRLQHSHTGRFSAIKQLELIRFQ